MKKPIVIEIIIWTAILTAIFCALIFGYSKFFVEPNIYTIKFKDIDGITEGSPVRFMGINVGYVRSLKSKDKYINVQILITKKDMKIPNGTAARVEFYGLGGSKSIELMPPDGSCDVGILSGDTIRIDDVVRESQSIVAFIEMIEKYVKGINHSKAQKMLQSIYEIKDETLKTTGNNFDNMGQNITKEIDTIRQKQNENKEKIKDIDGIVEKINKFIKK